MTKYLTPIAIVLAGIIIAGAIIYIQNPQSANKLPEKTKEEPAASVSEFSLEGAHIRGNSEAPVAIVEFSDFQCPFCQRFHPTVQQILADYPDKVRWAYKHFPLDQIHAQARPAAEASECIWEQKGNDGFWQFTDLLFENQSRLGESLYRELAGQIGLNLEQFNSCVSSRKYKDKVEADYQEGIAAGVRGTPGSFVNGEPISGAVPYETLKEAVERALSSLR